MLALLGVGIPGAFAIASGVAEIPRVDDWVYRRIAVDFATTGNLGLHSVTTMMVGMIVAAQPLLRLTGESSTAFAIAGLGFACAAVVGAFSLARQFLGVWPAALVASLVAIFPGYLAYATSFMTDAPALAAQLVCLALGVRALRAGPVRLRLLALAALVGFLGFSIREFAIAAPFAVLASAVWSQPRRIGVWTIAVGFALGCAGLYAIKLTAPGQVVSGGVGTGTLANILPAITTICLVVSPAAAIAARRHIGAWSRFDLALGAEVGLTIVGFLAFMSVRDGTIVNAFLGDLVSQYGVPTGAYIIGGRPMVFADPVWIGLNVLALGATVLTSSVTAGVVGAYLRRCRQSGRNPMSVVGRPAGILLLFASATLGGLAIYGAKYALFDRYFWPLLPPLAVLLMYRARSGPNARPSSSTPRGWTAVATGAWVVLLTMSLLFMLNSLAFDAARWRGGEQLVGLGIPAQEVDAGYEWVGQHQPELPLPNPPIGNTIFYEYWWPGRLACGIVAGSPDPQGAVVVGAVPWNLFLVGGPTEQLYLYRRTAINC